MAMSKLARQLKIAEIIAEAEDKNLLERVKTFAQFHAAKTNGLLPAHDNENLREYVELHEIAYRRALTKGLKTDEQKEERIGAALRTARRRGYQPLHYANPDPPTSDP